MGNNKKLIAAIFEAQKVFITFSGDCYRYDKQQNGFRCFKMNRALQRKFWEDYRKIYVGQSQNMTSWQPVACSMDDEICEFQNDSEKKQLQGAIMDKLHSRNLTKA